MLFVSRLPFDVQAQTLISALAANGAVLDPARANRLCVGLAGREEKAAAKWLRAELSRLHISIKHTHALRLVGKLSGREGWHSAPAPETQFRLMLTGLDTPRGWDVLAHDPEELLDLLCPALGAWATKVTKPRIATIRRSPQEILLSQDVLKDELGILVMLQAERASDWDKWFRFQNYAVERIRRTLEEGNAPVFVDGAVRAMLPCSKIHGVRELTVFDRTTELGRGTELHVLELMEAAAGEELRQSTVNGNAVSTTSHSFFLMESYRRLEPLLETSERTLLQPETQQLLRQYQVFRRKTGAPLSDLRLSGRYISPDGIPQELPVDWDAVQVEQVRRGATIASMFAKAESTEVNDVLLQKPRVISLSAFVQIATALEVSDFNVLVRQARWSEASAAEEKTLRSVLYAVDDVRFVVGREFTFERDKELREACQELSTSRRVRQLEKHGKLRGGLDEVVFAEDGADFLAVANECGAEVRMQVVPVFISTKELDIPMKLELPAVGRLLTLFLRPINPS